MIFEIGGKHPLKIKEILMKIIIQGECGENYPRYDGNFYGGGYLGGNFLRGNFQRGKLRSTCLKGDDMCPGTQDRIIL